MRALIINTACAALLVTGCGSKSGQSLVVVSVDADAQLNDVATLHARATVGATTREFDVHPTTGGALSIPPAQTFGIDLPHGMTGSLALHVDALDSTGAVTASGDGSGPISVGARADVSIHLAVGAVGDLGGEPADLAGTATDMAQPPGDMVVVPPAMLTIDKTTQSFGDIVVGKTSTTASFLVVNGGGMPTSVATLTPGGANLSEFTIDTDCGPSLAPGGRCHVTASVAPTSAGMKTATFSLAATQGGSVGGTVTANALTAGAVKIMQASGDCGSSLVGTQSATVASFTVQNTGASPTTALTVNTSDAQFKATGCAGSTLDAGGMCTVTVKFTPTSAGTQNASLTVTATTGGTDTASLVGVGLKPASLKIAPTSMTSFTKGQTQTFTISNDGDVNSGNLATAALAGSNAASFSIVTDHCKGNPVGPSPAACTIDVKFAPTTTGTQSATLSTSATPGGSLLVNLGGPGLVPASLHVSPDHVAFATTPRTSQSGPTQTFTVTNSGDIASPTMALATVTGSGANASSFTITSDGCQGNPVNPSPASCQIVVKFTPQITGANSATLNINTATSTAIMVPLTGTGSPTWVQEAGSLTLAPLNAVWAADASHVYAVGDSGTILYRDTTGTWNLRTLSANPLPSLTAVSGSSATNVLVAGSGIYSSTDSKTWTAWETNAKFSGVLVTATNDIWGSYYAFGSPATWGLYHFTSATGWAPVKDSDGNNSFGLHSVWGTTANDVYTFGGTLSCALGACSSEGAIYHPNAGGDWVAQYSQEEPNPTADVSSMWGFGSPANNLYATTTTATTPLHSTGNGTWTAMGGSAPSGCSSVWGSSASAVWFGCSGAAYLWNGSVWTAYSLGAGRYVGAYGTGPNDVYLVGSNTSSDGVIYHYY